MALDMTTVESMVAAGIAFEGSFRVPGGGRSVRLAPKDIPAFVADQEEFAAEYLGVSKSQYLEWVKLDGNARCGARTAKGKVCRNYMSGSTQLPIKEWLERDGGNCAVHSGESSERADVIGKR